MIYNSLSNKPKMNMSIQTKNTLDKMQENFENRNGHSQNNSNVANKVSTLSNNKNENNSGLFNQNNNLSSLLPLLQLMLDKDKKSLGQNSMQELLLKNFGVNNSMFNELFSLLNKTKKAQNTTDTQKKEEEKSISSYTKTNPNAD